MSDDLPQGWAETTLEQVGKWRTGGTPSRRQPDYFGKGIPWVKSGDLPDGPILRTEEEITKLGLDNSSAKLMPVGTISMALYGATIGKLGIMTFPAATNQACANVVPDNRVVESSYLLYYLLSERRNFIEQGQGGAQPNISQEIVRTHPVHLAPLNEQRRVVAKLEKLLGKVDACQQRLAKIPVLLKRFRQSVLAAACSGRLTADWRGENPTSEEISETLSAIRKRREAEAKTPAKKQNLREIFSAVEENDSTDLPESWRFLALKKLCSSFDYGTSAKSQPSGDVPVLRMGNIQDGRLDWTDLVFTSDKEEIDNYSLQPNTVLFNRTNSPELVGKTAIYRGERPAIFAGYLIRINPLQELSPEYLNICLNTNYAKEYCLRVKTDGVSQSNINAQKLAAFELPFCPPVEQQEIVHRVEALFVLADQIEARYAKAKAHVEKLTQSVLAKAFRGELVPQDPNDEPASELLKRIKMHNVDSKR